MDVPAKSSPVPTPAEVLEQIGGDPAGHGRRIWRRLSLITLVLGSVAVALYLLQGEPAQAIYTTEPVTRGPLEQTVRATGTLEARRVVSIGGEISGRVDTVEVEVNDRVSVDQVLATLETDSLDHAVTQASASQKSAKASASKARANLALAKLLRERTEALVKDGSVAREELDQAIASESLARAELSQARAQLVQAQVGVDQAVTDRGKATITSPIDGVVLTRSVEPGNAIAAALAAPELFVIAEDLSKMSLDLLVDEADVGRLEAGQLATFSVDAYPGRVFDARLERVDLAPTSDSSSTGVVTYRAVLSVDNVDEVLRPGMTATATIVTRRHTDVLRVSDRAFRFDPEAAIALEEEESSNPLAMRPPRRKESKQSARKVLVAGQETAIYILRDGDMHEVSVTPIASDGTRTAVESEGLQEGDEAILAVHSSEDDSG